MPEVTLVTIVDNMGNTLADMEAVGGTIKFSEILTKITARSESENHSLRNRVENLETEIRDLKEAFEHSDDSLSNLRTAVAELKEEHNGHE